MRIFIAVDIGSAVRKRIAEIQASLMEKTGLRKGPVTWVQPGNIHLTLKFLGEVADEAITEVCRIVAEAAAKRSPFDLEAAGLGTFGRPPRVLWAGVQVVPELARLQADLEKRLAEAGWPPEGRAFTAHLTLCRIKEPKAGRKLAEACEEYKNSSLGPVSVDEVVVFESQLTREGSIYTAVSRCALNG